MSSFTRNFVHLSSVEKWFLVLLKVCVDLNLLIMKFCDDSLFDRLESLGGRNPLNPPPPTPTLSPPIPLPLPVPPQGFTKLDYTVKFCYNCIKECLLYNLDYMLEKKIPYFKSTENNLYKD
jgi:hypothetical protein